MTVQADSAAMNSNSQMYALMSPSRDFLGASGLNAAMANPYGNIDLANQTQQYEQQALQEQLGTFAIPEARLQFQMQQAQLQQYQAQMAAYQQAVQQAAQDQAMKQQAFNTLNNLMSSGFYGQGQNGTSTGIGMGQSGIFGSGLGIGGGVPMLGMNTIGGLTSGITPAQTNILQSLAGGPTTPQNQAIMNQALQGQQQQFNSHLNNLAAASNRGSPLGTNQAQLSSLMNANLMGNAQTQQSLAANQWNQQLQAAGALAQVQNQNAQLGLQGAQIQAGLLGQNLTGAQNAYQGYANGLMGSFNNFANMNIPMPSALPSISTLGGGYIPGGISSGANGAGMAGGGGY